MSAQWLYRRMDSAYLSRKKRESAVPVPNVWGRWWTRPCHLRTTTPFPSMPLLSVAVLGHIQVCALVYRCYGRNLKLIAVPTLELMCVPVLLRETVQEDNALLCPMIDARRMEVYSALFDRSLKTVREVKADVVTAETYKQWLDERPIYFFGNGAKKCMETINHPHAHLIEGIEPLAKWMQPLAERRFLNEQFEDVAYFVPFYLKDFVAIKPKKLL